MSDATQATTTNLRPVHATIAGVAVHNADFVIAFGVIVPSFGQGCLGSKVSLEALANVSLSPPAAKQLFNQLGRAIDNFEKATGISIPVIGEISESDASSRTE
jgi:hypothetical protein